MAEYVGLQIISK